MAFRNRPFQRRFAPFLSEGRLHCQPCRMPILSVESSEEPSEETKQKAIKEEKGDKVPFLPSDALPFVWEGEI